MFLYKLQLYLNYTKFSHIHLVSYFHLFSIITDWRCSLVPRLATYSPENSIKVVIALWAIYGRPLLQLYTLLTLLYHNISCRLRGTTDGANNRLDPLALITTGINVTEVRHSNDDVLGVVEGWQENETHNPDVPAVSHRRGLAPFVFVPFEEVCLLYLLFNPLDLSGKLWNIGIV